MSYPNEMAKWRPNFEQEKSVLNQSMKNGSKGDEYQAQRNSFMLSYSNAVIVLGQNPLVVRINTGMYI